MFQTKPVKTREEGLRRLLEVFRKEKEGWSLEKDAIVLADGRRVPLMSWRTHYHVTSMLSFTRGEKIKFGPAHSSAMPGPSAFRLLYSGCRSEGLNAMLRRELDLSEFMLGAKTVHVFAMANGDVLHVSTRLDNGVVCTLELNATLPEGSAPVYKHELTTESGFVTDRAVDTTVTPESMYLLNGEGVQSFSSVDAVTYGLCREDIIDVRAAYAILCDEERAQEYIDASRRLDRLCALVWKSAETGKRLDAGEVNE